MAKTSGLIPQPLSIQKRAGADFGENAAANQDAKEGSVETSESSPFNNPQNEGRGCLPCYYVHERCSLRDTPAVPCQRCKQKSLECILFPAPNGPRDPEKRLTSPRTPKSTMREVTEKLKTPDLHPKGPRPKPDKEKE